MTCKMPICIRFFQWEILARKLAQADLGFRLKSLLVGVCMQDYKSLCPVVTICSTLVNIQTSGSFLTFVPCRNNSLCTWNSCSNYIINKQ